MPYLLISIHFLEGRFHGRDARGRQQWPPSPATLFQALTAGAARGCNIPEQDCQALVWLEQLEPPLVLAPPARSGQAIRSYVPNNDLDTLQGDPARIGKIRSAKQQHPFLFDKELPLLYAWSFDTGMEQAARCCTIAQRLYQLGRGVDMAWAVAEILEQAHAETLLHSGRGRIYRPCLQGDGRRLTCPQPGSLQSMQLRQEGISNQYRRIPGKARGLALSRAPKARFREVAYDCPPVRLVFELRDTSSNAGFFAWPLAGTSRLVECVRNLAQQKLLNALPEQAMILQGVFGLRRNTSETDKASRIRIIPLPSIGHTHADRGIRRLLLEIPPDCPLEVEDVNWAFSGFGSHDPETGEVPWMLVPAEDNSMLVHYGIDETDRQFYRKWRSVTPVALPTVRTYGRSNGNERAENEQQAALAFSQALRHAGLPSNPTTVRFQREPFETKGSRAETFAPGTRFGSSRLWHVEFSYEQPISGPLLAGDGRYLGLGLFRPVKSIQDVHVFSVIEGLTPQAEYFQVAGALRRAVMSLVQSKIGLHKPLPLFFCGHEPDGSPARRGGKAHLAFAFDKPRKRLLVIAPHRLEGREPYSRERDNMQLLDVALADLRELRAGPTGLLKLRPATFDDEADPLFASAQSWFSLTAYRPTRHIKHTTLEQAIVADVETELQRRGLPKPQALEVRSATKGPKGGFRAHLKLLFSVGVRGPLLLGKNCNVGGGLFVTEAAIQGGINGNKTGGFQEEGY